MASKSDMSHFASSILEAVCLPLLALDPELRVAVANDAFLKHFQVAREEAVGRRVYDLCDCQWDIPELRRALEEILPRQSTFDDFEIEHAFGRAGRRVMLLNVRRLDDVGLIILAIRDITDQRAKDATRREREARETLLQELNDGLRSIHDPLAIQAKSSEILARHLGAEQVAFAEINEPGVCERIQAVGSPDSAGRDKRVSLVEPFIADLKRGRTVVVDDIHSDPRTGLAEIARGFETQSISALIEVPVVEDDRLVAMLAVHSSAPRRWSASEAAIAEAVAGRAWPAVARARAETALGDCEARLAGLREALEAALNDEPLEASLGVLARMATARLGGNARVAFYLANPQRTELHHVVGMPADYAEAVKGMKVGPESLACGLAAYSRSPVITSDVAEEPRWASWLWLAKKFGYRGCWSFPIYTRTGAFVGSFAVYSPHPRQATTRDIELAGLITQTAAIIIARDAEAQLRKQGEEALRESEARYRFLFESIDESFTVVEPLYEDGQPVDYRFVEVNPAFQAITGLKTAVGRTGRELIPDLEKDWIDTIGRVAATGEAQRVLRRARSLGKIFDAFLFRVEGWKSGRVAILSRDVTERVRAEEQRSLLMRELNHRSKNMLSIVLAIARATAGKQGRDFEDKFQERILSLSTNQDLLVASDWQGVLLEDLVRSQLAHLEDLLDGRVRVHGPRLTVSAAASQSFSMALHELATNAVKYGALSNPDGRVDIEWGVETQEGGSQRFTMRWRETGGPSVVPPARSGFGSTVIRDMVRLNLRGEARLEYGSGGVLWEFDCPLENVLQPESEP
jgi:PAS domain S-box-containing protein